MDEIALTAHAIDRARECLGWNEKTLRRMVAKVSAHGVRQRDTRGRLRRWLDAQSMEHRKGDGNLLFGEHIYIIQAGTLITVYRLPKEFHRAANDAAPKNDRLKLPGKPLDRSSNRQPESTGEPGGRSGVGSRL